MYVKEIIRDPNSFHVTFHILYGENNQKHAKMQLKSEVNVTEY